MKNTRKLLLSTMFVAFAIFLFSACSKDDNAAPEDEDTTQDGANGDENAGMGSASATVTFLDVDSTVQFTGTAIGAIGTGEQDTVIMMFSGTNSPMAFFLMLTPVDKGTHVMGQGGFECHGIFYRDSLKMNLTELYFVGEDNIDDNGTEMDGQANFNISSLTKNKIKGTFELTMILNSTIKVNGETQSGEIKKVQITDGKFDSPLYDAADFDTPPV